MLASPVPRNTFLGNCVVDRGEDDTVFFVLSGADMKIDFLILILNCACKSREGALLKFEFLQVVSLAAIQLPGDTRGGKKKKGCDGGSLFAKSRSLTFSSEGREEG